MCGLFVHARLTSQSRTERGAMPNDIPDIVRRRRCAPNEVEEQSTMNARDVMSKPVISVHPDTPLGEIARLLLDKGISAVPVVDEKGAPIGMVSEDDLIRPDRAAREAWRQSWLEIFAEGEPLAPRACCLAAVSKPQRPRHYVSACYHGERGYGAWRNSARARRSPDQARAGGPRWPRHGDCCARRSFACPRLKQGRLVTPLIGASRPAHLMRAPH